MTARRSDKLASDRSHKAAVSRGGEVKRVTFDSNDLDRLGAGIEHPGPSLKEGEILRVTVKRGDVVHLGVERDAKVHRELQRKAFLNGVLSAYDLTGRTTDRLIDALGQQRAKRSPFQAVNAAFGVSAAHLSNAVQAVGEDGAGGYVTSSDPSRGSSASSNQRRLRE